MPSFDDILKASGAEFQDDDQLGRFYRGNGEFGWWTLSGKVDLPFQKDVPFSCVLTQDSNPLPESMRKNTHWFMDNLGNIWNAAAVVINTTIEADEIRIPEHFALGHVWAFFPDAPLETSEWRVEIEPRGMAQSFEVVFMGLAIVRYGSLSP